MVRAVIFDLDGTLLDTVEDIRAHVNAMLRLFGYPEITLEQTRAYIGDGAHKLVERALPRGAENAEECYGYFRRIFAESDNSLTHLFAGEKEALGELCSRGVKLAVVTNKPQNAADGCMKKFFSDIPFAFVGGDTGEYPCKPDPALTLRAVRMLGAEPADCAFVGDGETDVKTARNAGIRGVSCLWGYRSREQLERAGAVRFAADFSDLQKILENL